MADTIRVVDVSEFTTDIDPSWWARLRDAQGVRGAIIQAWGGGAYGGPENVFFAQQALGALAAGLGLGAYCWPPADWQSAIQHVGMLRSQLAFFALDVEAGEGVAPQHVDGVRSYGLTPVIYSNPNDWSVIMHNTTAFADCGLWLARYPMNAPEWEADISWALLGYGRIGGWTSVVGWQFRGTTAIEGESADLNLFLASAFQKPPPPAPREEEDVAYLVQPEGRPEVYATNGVTKTWLRSQAVLDELKAKGIVIGPIKVMTRAAIDNLQLLGPAPP